MKINHFLNKAIVLAGVCFFLNLPPLMAQEAGHIEYEMGRDFASLGKKKEARRWYHVAAKQGYSQALEYLGLVLIRRTHLRAAPSLESAKHRTLSPQTRCHYLARGVRLETVERRTDFWYHVRCRKQEGWVFGANTSARLSQRFEVTQAQYNSEQTSGLSKRFELLNQPFFGWDAPCLFEGNDPEIELKIDSNQASLSDFPTSNPAHKKFRITWTVEWLKIPQKCRFFYPSSQIEMPKLLAIDSLESK